MSPRPRPQQSSATVQRRRLLGAAGALSLALATGCTLNPDEDHAGADAPASGTLPRAPRIAWVFSSGGPRGFVHVGVLKALDELALVPDLIVGASVGAVMGVMRAAGLPAREIVSLALELDPLRLARLAVGGSERLSGTAVRELVREHVAPRRLEQLPTPMVCAAQRLVDGTVVGFNRGDVGLAVQAAAAIEGQFSPVRIRGQRYADSDRRMPLPVRLAKALGAVRVLAVDASAHEDRAPAGAARYREGDVLKRALTQPDAALADVLLHPDFGYWVNLSREFRERAIEAGYRATLAQAVQLRALHAA